MTRLTLAFLAGALSLAAPGSSSLQGVISLAAPTTFGEITSTSNSARVMQGAIRYEF
jgi:hypothetical protein